MKQLTKAEVGAMSTERLMRESSHIRTLKISRGWKVVADVPRVYLSNWLLLTDELHRRAEQLQLF